MSGGVGPSPTYDDINLPKEQEQFPEHESKQTSSKNKTHQAGPKKRPPRLSFQHLNCLAVVIILSAAGLVCSQDMFFVLFSIIYMYFLSVVAFPKLTTSPEAPFFRKTGLFAIYVLVSAIIGLFLPILYIFEGIFKGDREGVKAAAPHLFLLASQVVMEGIALSDWFSTPIWVFIPVFYNSMRIFSLVEWLRTEFSKGKEDFGGSPIMRLYVGRGLALANMAFWCFNLFGFLLPVFLPKAFKRYYSDHKVKD